MLQEEFRDNSDLAIITGDFNVLRYPFPASFETRLVEANPDLKAIIDKVNSEYEDVLLKTLVSTGF